MITGSSAFADDDKSEKIMPAMLRLYEDVLWNDFAVSLPALPRMIFVVHGEAAVADRTLRDGEAWSGEAPVTVKAGAGGATLLEHTLVTGITSEAGRVTGVQTERGRIDASRRRGL